MIDNRHFLSSPLQVGRGDKQFDEVRDLHESVSGSRSADPQWPADRGGAVADFVMRQSAAELCRIRRGGPPLSYLHNDSY